jgi:excinuclease UvrABC nuclease subunit
LIELLPPFELESIANAPAVFLLWAQAGRPEIARTNVLKRRLTRAIKTLGSTISRIQYQLTGSRLESWFVLWEQARRHLGPDYRRVIRLRLPPYVKLGLSHRFPRTQITHRLARAPGIYFGPFRNRATAAKFEGGFLDLFQVRRCEDDLSPHPEHAGCMYGEMGRCLRPCQQAVSEEEYRTEATRVAEFLRTRGLSLIEPARTARDRLSADMDFEGAALMHQRVEKIEQVLAESDEMAREISNLNGVTVTRSAEPECIDLGWLRGGFWQGFTRLEFRIADGQPVSLDARLRAASVRPVMTESSAARTEHLAILARWFYSSWRDGEMLLIDEWDKMPWRKMVNAVSRVAGQQRPR